jgi:hypothetical protein
MTDYERLSLVCSLMVVALGGARDPPVLEDVGSPTQSVGHRVIVRPGSSSGGQQPRRPSMC